MGRRRRMHADRAVALIRVSTEEQQNGPKAQRDAIERFAAANGLRVVSWHEELGVSGGAPLDERPTLWDAVEQAHAQRAGTFLVAKRDRLARDMMATLLIEQRLEGMGVRLMSADGAANEQTPEAELMRGLLSLFAQYERAVIGARTRAALAARKARGLRTGGVPYGMRAVDGRLEPDPREQPAVELIARMRAEGETLRSIVDALNADPTRYPPRGERWHMTSAYRIYAAART